MENKIKEMLCEVECYLFDLDGTLYMEGKPLPNALETIAWLRGKGKKVAYLTNNSSVSTADYKAKLERLGLEVEEGGMLSSGGATIFYLQNNHAGKSVYLVGTKSLQAEFAGAGIKLWKEEDGGVPDVCVLSYDTELEYEKLVLLTRFLTLGSEYIATHPDINCPADIAYKPDIGSFMALVEKSTGKTPSVICGKPHDAIASLARSFAGGGKIAMVGDRLSTDIAFGNRHGFVSVLVLSGETTAEMAEASEVKADVVLGGVGEICFCG